MKKALRIILFVLVSAVVLAAAVILTLRFAFDIDVFDRSGWHETREGGWQYRAYNGTPLTGWQTIDGDIYYFDPNRDDTMAADWQTVGGFRYYLGTEGKAAVGWTEVEGSRYFFGETGVMASGWLEQDGQRYWLGDDGTMRTGWVELPEGRYYLDEGGVMQTGWVEFPEGRYWLREDGAMHTGWVELDTGRYYLGEDGVMVTGWLMLEGSRYFFDETGVMARGWTETDGGIYYLDETGVMRTGWLELDGKRYYLKPSGRMYTGWMHTEEGSYYFREDGAMAVGRVEIGGVNRHFTSAGKYVVLVNRWNPVPEDYETELVTLRGFKVSAEARDAMEQMIRDCNAAGIYCGINSIYRSYEYQNRIWSEQVERYVARGYSREWAIETTNKSIAVPGTSEHQLGLAIDLACGDDGYAWLAKHGWEYGFIMRYPYGDTEWTGILYEPWHYRYVGVELAKELYDLGLCMEEYMELLTEQAGYEPAEIAA